MDEDLERLKQRLPLLEYLQQQHWTLCRTGPSQEFVGLCPLHPETRPSFYVNARKNLFYCHGGSIAKFNGGASGGVKVDRTMTLVMRRCQIARQ